MENNNLRRLLEQQLALYNEYADKNRKEYNSFNMGVLSALEVIIIELSDMCGISIIPEIDMFPRKFIKE